MGRESSETWGVLPHGGSIILGARGTRRPTAFEVRPPPPPRREGVAGAAIDAGPGADET